MKHGFSTTTRNGVIVSDYSQSMSLYTKLLNYIFLNINFLAKKYDLPLNYVNGQIIQHIINVEITKRIK